MPFPASSGPLRHLPLTFAAAALAVAGATARPAQADTDDLLRFLAGAIVIAAIVNAVDDNHRAPHISQWVLPDSCLETVRANRRSVEVYNARCLNRANYSNLPGECRYDYQYNGRNRSGYVAECMWDAGYRRQGYSAQPAPAPSRPSQHSAGVLPAHCEMTYRQSGQRVTGYWGDCLNNAGYYDMPRYCQVTSTSGDAIYNAECLFNANYRRR
jgi:hypothetical protein